MSISRLPVAVLLGQLSATSLFANTAEPVNAVSPQYQKGIVLAQAGGTLLSGSDIRRLDHYAGEAMQALLAIDEGAPSDSVQENLRQKIMRLIDAGARSGIGIEDTATYFTAFLENNSGPGLPDIALGTDGRPDARNLLATVNAFVAHAPQNAPDIEAVEMADLAALRQHTSVEAPVQNEEAGTLQITMAEPAVAVVEVPTGPEVPVDATTEVRDVLERVRLRGNDWVITVETGDTLSKYADALYGDRRQFGRIMEANAASLTRADTITVGIELVLPKP